MKIALNPPRSQWNSLLARPQLDTTQLEATVQDVLVQIRKGGDEALRQYVHRFDDPSITHFEISAHELSLAETQVSHELKQAIETAITNIQAFHAAQRETMPVIETMPGVRCWRKSIGIEKVGLYIPGGTAPLFSTILMLGIPAQLAGCKEIILCTPQRSNQPIHPAVLYAAKRVGIHRVFRIGGAQAIAAMAYGTETIPQVYKIFGPGNQYVTMAKMLVAKEGVAIDMPAGPSEVMVVADDTANPAFVAADLLSQAEHGTDSQAVLLTNSKALLQAVEAEVAKQLANLPRRALAEQSLAYSRLILLEDKAELIELMNQYAAEHLILSVQNFEALAAEVRNAGSVFLGNYSPESAGDYASGTNHTLPTNGYARAYSGVSLDSFVRKITFQHLTQEGLQLIGPAIEALAEAEQLDAHKNAVSLRLK